MYPYFEKLAVHSPAFLFDLNVSRILSEVSSKYHSSVKPNIWLAFLVSLLVLSILSTVVRNLTFHSWNKLCMYFSISSESLANLAYVLHKTISTFPTLHSSIILLKFGRELSAPDQSSSS